MYNWAKWNARNREWFGCAIKRLYGECVIQKCNIEFSYPIVNHNNNKKLIQTLMKSITSKSIYIRGEKNFSFAGILKV